eukprot:CAMPEP_0198702590 /NCGR_PEP_ID=MMETSP1468-20131203/388845_1 /TAXON_ID=1461545 /ORGANISM="Mantoniella sp, Strain CCMP1436" /LENGTH=36 /DNA_ID= /DNA_START= /DNA_END= /DNA_ORIENTATION=
MSDAVRISPSSAELLKADKRRRLASPAGARRSLNIG